MNTTTTFAQNILQQLEEYGGYDGPIKRTAKKLGKLVVSGAAIGTGIALDRHFDLGHHAKTAISGLLEDPEVLHAKRTIQSFRKSN